MSASREGRSARIRQAITDAGRLLSAPEVAEAIGEDSSTVSQNMSLMYAAGILYREGSTRTFRYGVARDLRKGGPPKKPPMTAEERRARDRERYRRNLARDGGNVRARRQPAAAVRKAAAPKAAVLLQAPQVETLAAPCPVPEPETVAEFEARGGVIQRLPPGACSRPLLGAQA